MAKSKIPNPLERRHLIERALSADRARAIAEDYINADRVFEAIDFLEKADAQDRLAELRNGAIESGDAFLLRAVANAGWTIWCIAMPCWLNSVVSESTRNGISSCTTSTTVCGDCQPCWSNWGL